MYYIRAPKDQSSRDGVGGRCPFRFFENLKRHGGPVVFSQYTLVTYDIIINRHTCRFLSRSYSFRFAWKTAGFLILSRRARVFPPAPPPRVHTVLIEPPFHLLPPSHVVHLVTPLVTDVTAAVVVSESERARFISDVPCTGQVKSFTCDAFY